MNGCCPNCGYCPCCGRTNHNYGIPAPRISDAFPPIYPQGPTLTERILNSGFGVPGGQQLSSLQMTATAAGQMFN
jgi:hypothetical protein